MRRSRSILAATLVPCGTLLVHGGPVVRQHEDPPPYQITALRAYLYFNQKDSLSPNLIDNPSVGDLFNTDIGAGWARSPSDEVVMTVEIAGKPGSYASGRKVVLKVTKKDGTILVNRGPDIGLIGDNGKYFKTFLLYQTGCDPVHIRAELLGQPIPSVVEKDIPFFCGE